MEVVAPIHVARQDAQQAIRQVAASAPKRRIYRRYFALLERNARFATRKEVATREAVIERALETTSEQVGGFYRKRLLFGSAGALAGAGLAALCSFCNLIVGALVSGILDKIGLVQAGPPQYWKYAAMVAGVVAAYSAFAYMVFRGFRAFLESFNRQVSEAERLVKEKLKTLD